VTLNLCGCKAFGDEVIRIRKQNMIISGAQFRVCCLVALLLNIVLWALGIGS
jgi:hypothetical protein